MNLDVLQRNFTVTENPGLDTLDPRWAEVSGLAQAGQFAEAARAAEELLAADVCDVRLVGYLCFGHFLDEGPRALPAIFAALGTMLEGNWHAIGPAPQRAKITQQSLAWLFKQICKLAQHAESSKDETWQGWTRGVTPERLDEALSRVPALQTALSTRLELAAAAPLDALSKLQAWLRSFAAAARAQLDSERPSAPPPAQAAPAASDTLAPAAAPARAEPAAGSSYHLVQLMRKIDALGRLLDGGKLPAARIVADDVSAILGSFDPYLYFPSLFARFARMMARHAGVMAEQELDPEAPVPKALRALYQVDLDGFLELE